MNPFEAYIVELLKDNITTPDDMVVEVRRQFMPKTTLPCITLDLLGDTTDYTYYDIELTEELHVVRTSNINIHTWCNDEKTREHINQQVLTCFYDSLSHHYKYCTNYNDGTCNGNGGLECAALTTINARSIKQKCPDPDLYGYECLTEKHGIGYNTVTIDTPFFSDEVNEHPPLLHSIFRCSCGYDEVVRRNGEAVMNDVEYDDL